MTPRFSMHHRFVPVWDRNKSAVTTFRCVTQVEPEMTDALGRTERSQLEVTVTLARLKHAASILSDRLAQNNRFIAWLPIPYEVLGNPIARLEILTFCRELRQEMRPHLIFEIEQLPIGVPESRLMEFSGLLRPFSRGVAASLSPGTASYSVYPSAGLFAMGLHLTGSPGEREMLSELFKLGAAVEKQNIEAFAFNLPTQELTKAACDYQINQLSGPMIGMAQDLPGNVHRLDGARLFGSSQASAAA